MAHADFLKYGGDTTSALIQGGDGAQVLIDAGTGIRALGSGLEKKHSMPHLLLLMTHYHLDHIMGLPSLSLIYNKNWTVDIAAPIRDGVSVEQAVKRILDKPFWPVQLEQLLAKVSFTTLPGDCSSEPLRYRGLEIRWCAVHHPEGCTAYRIDEPATGAALVFATDIEWALSDAAEKEAFIRLCREPRPPDALFFDGQFTPENYERFKGWGHSTWRDALAVGEQVKAGKVLVIHHAPQSDDATLDRIDAEIRKAGTWAALARQHQEFEWGMKDPGKQGVSR